MRKKYILSVFFLLIKGLFQNFVFCADFVATLDSSNGSSAFSIRNSLNTEVVRFDSNGFLTLSSNIVAGSGAQALTLKPGSLDHAYFAINADSDNSTTRSAWFGYGSAGTQVFTISNELGKMVYVPYNFSVGSYSGGTSFEVSSQSSSNCAAFSSSSGIIRLIFDNSGNMIQSGNSSWNASRQMIISGYNGNLCSGVKIYSGTLEVSGKLGIGTDIPLHEIDIRSASDPRIQIKAETGGGEMFMEAQGGTLGLIGSSNNIGVGVYTNNTERARFSNDGRISIGADAADNASILGGQVSRLILRAVPYTYSGGPSVGAAMTVLASGSQTNQLSSFMSFGHAGIVWSMGLNTDDGVTGLDNGDNNDFVLMYNTTGSPSTYLSVASNGYTGLGVSTPQQRIDFDGNVRQRSSGFCYYETTSQHLAFSKKSGGYGYYFRKTDDGLAAGPNLTNLFLIAENGDISGVHGSYHVASDARLKKNVTVIENALDKVMELRGVNFNWIDETKDEGRRQMGLIAQEVEKVVPEATHTASDEIRTKSVIYDKLTALLIEAVKELGKKLEARIEDMEKEIEKLQ